MFNNVFANVIRADGAARESMIANCAGTISNIALDALFILIFSWDVAGAAWATVLGNCVSCLYLLYYMTRKQPLLSLSRSSSPCARKSPGPWYPWAFPWPAAPF